MAEKYISRRKDRSVTDWEFHIRGSIESFEDYDNMFLDFAKVSKDDSVAICLNTPGGDCSIGFFIIDQILKIPCKVHMIVDYPTYSMGAIMALCGHSLTIKKDCYIMFHDYSGGSHGKGEESAAYVNNFRKVFKDRFTRLCKPFLAPKEIEKMFKGEDIYIHWDDPSLKERTKRHFN